jgi:hypothetical protein
MGWAAMDGLLFEVSFFFDTNVIARSVLCDEAISTIAISQH